MTSCVSDACAEGDEKQPSRSNCFGIEPSIPLVRASSNELCEK